LDSLLIIVHFHVECLDILGVVVEDNWSLKDLIGEILLVLRCKIYSPVDFVLKLDFLVLDVSFKDLNSLCVGNSSEWSIYNFL